MNTYSLSVTGIQKIFATIAVLAMVFSPLAGVQFAGAAVGEVKTVTGSCGAPVNANQYEEGQAVLLKGVNFLPNTLLDWDISEAGGAKTTIASGQVLTDGNGEFCFTAIPSLAEGTVEGSPYKATAGDKSDNFSVVEGTNANGTIVVVKVLENEPEGVTPDDFSFTVNGGDAVQFDADGSNNSIQNLNDGPFTVVEVEANGQGYETTYSGSCTAVALTTEGATCTITNTYEPVVVLCTDPEAYNYNQEAPCVYQGCIDDGALNYDDTATIAGTCEYPVVTLCKYDGSQNALSGWELFLDDGVNAPYADTTDGSGCVDITVPLGDYTVGETLLPGWVPVSGNGASVTVDDATHTWNLINRPEADQCLNIELEQTEVPPEMVRGNDGNCYFPGSLTVEKIVSGEGASTADDFYFTGGFAGKWLSESDGPYQVASGLLPGVHAIVENVLATNYDLADISCTPNDGNSTFEYNYTDDKVLVTLAEGEDVVCTFTNRHLEGTLTVNKIILGDTDATPDLFSYSVNAGSAVNFEVDGSNSETVTAGTYTVVETSAPGFTTTYSNNLNSDANCDNLAVADGEEAVCTITNRVIPDEMSCLFNSNDYSVSSGQEFTLSWDTENADFVEIDNGIGDVDLDGSVNTSITSDTTFTLTASRYIGDSEELESITCEVDIDRRSSGGGGGGTRVDRDPDPEEPEGEVLGEQTEILPLGAPDTGAGGTSPVAPKLPTLLATLVAGVRRTKNV